MPDIVRNEKTGEEKWVWLVTTSKEIDYKILWKMMHKRWDIEENAFYQLKTYYHAAHCYCHEAVEVIFLLMLIAFNIRKCICTGISMDLREAGLQGKV